MFVLSPHLHLSFAFLAAYFLGRLAHILAFPLTTYATEKLSIFAKRIQHIQLSNWLIFRLHVY